MWIYNTHKFVSVKKSVTHKYNKKTLTGTEIFKFIYSNIGFIGLEPPQVLVMDDYNRIPRNRLVSEI